MPTIDSRKVLIIDDEPDILKFLSYNLSKEGYKVETANDGFHGIEKARSGKPDLILLDIMMPELDGIETCKMLREIDELNETFIAFLSARSEDYSQIAGFESGGDDYIVKPIRPKLLIARINALFNRKRFGSKRSHIESYGNIVIDKEKRLVYKGEDIIEFPKKEYELLLLLCSKIGKVFSREQIYQSLWGNDHNVGGRTIDVYIRKLREKIGEDSIKTLKGVGYKYNEFYS